MQYIFLIITTKNSPQHQFKPLLSLLRWPSDLSSSLLSICTLRTQRWDLLVWNESLKALSVPHRGWMQQGDERLLGNTNLLIVYTYSIPVSISTIITMGYVTSALCAGWCWMIGSRRNHLGVHHWWQLWIKALLLLINHGLWCAIHI